MNLIRPKAFASPGGCRTEMESPCFVTSKPCRARKSGSSESLGKYSFSMIDSGTFHDGFRTTNSISSEKIGVGVLGFPTITRALWTEEPFSTTSSSYPGMLTNTYEDQRSRGNHRQRSK